MKKVYRLEKRGGLVLMDFFLTPFEKVFSTYLAVGFLST